MTFRLTTWQPGVPRKSVQLLPELPEPSRPVLTEIREPMMDCVKFIATAEQRLYWTAASEEG